MQRTLNSLVQISAVPSGINPLKLGRTLRPTDREGNTPVAVVNEAFVEEFLSGLDPLRARVRVQDGAAPFEIVGVVGNTKHTGLDDEHESAMYFSIHLQYECDDMFHHETDLEINLESNMKNTFKMR